MAGGRGGGGAFEEGGVIIRGTHETRRLQEDRVISLPIDREIVCEIGHV